MTLTIILTIDAEKDPKLARAYFQSLARWNRKGMDRTQVIVVCQKEKDPETLRLASRQPFPVDVVFARHEMVEGYPVWDICEEARLVWPMVRGEYVTFNHAEFLWCPHRLERLLRFLAEESPTIALGNLRRPGLAVEEGTYTNQNRDSGAEEVERLYSEMEYEEWFAAGAVAESMPTGQWIWWETEQPTGPAEWLEDVFFAKKAWFDETRFFWQAKDLFFQDIYDLMGAAIFLRGKYGKAPDVYRMDQRTHRMIHLPHPCGFQSFSPAMRNWFLKQSERFAGTTFARQDLWDALLAPIPANHMPVVAIRRGRGGTMTRFVKAMERGLP